MTTRSKIILGSLLASVLGFGAAGCKNPAEGKPKAEVGEAKQTPNAPEGPAVESVTLSPSNTKIGWKGSKVTGSHDGGFKTFTGSVKAAAGDPLKAQIDLTIEMASIFSDNDRLTGHLQSDDFFSVKTFPQARFVSTAITAGGKKGASHTVTGNLTLRGVTKSVSFPATVKISPETVEANAEFWINRKLWGITYAGMKDDLIRDEVVIKLAIKAPRKK